MDLVLEIDLTERVLARPREGTPGGLNLVHISETKGDGGSTREHWSFWLQDEMLAEWDYDPRPPAIAD